MKGGWTRWIPILAGVCLGLLLVWAPGWLAPLGPLRYLAVVVVVAALLVGIVALLISANLPADVQLDPASGELHPELERLVAVHRGLGFEAGSPLRVGIRPPATLVPLLHASGKIFGSIFRTGTVPAKIAFDFVSQLEGELGGLTSLAEPTGATLPVPTGSLRQVFPGASPGAVFEHHQRALEYLEERGLPCRRVTAADFIPDFKRAMARQRAYFLGAPVRHTLVAIWRSTTRRVPCVGPIQTQARAQAQILQLLAERELRR